MSTNLEIHNPATGALIATLPADDALSVARHAAAARAAQPAWAATALSERIACMQRFRDGIVAELDLLAGTLTQEVGKPIKQSRNELNGLLGRIDFFCAEVERSIADLARNLDNVDRTSLKEYLVQHESGVRILPAPTRPSDWRNLSAAHIRDVVDVLAQTHDFVILDTPGTFNEIVAAAIEVGTMILLITTLDMASIKDTVLALEMLHERFGNDDERIKVVLNRAGIDTGVREKDVERTLDCDLWWRIPQDNEVVKAAQLGRPIVMNRPNSKVSVEIREIARALAGIRQKSKGAKRSGGGLGSLFKAFKKSA